MTAAFTVILPHRRNPENDAALSVALSCLFTNTVNDFRLLMDVAQNQPLYPRINRMVEQADTDCIVYLCSDQFVTPGWDVPMLDIWTQNPDTFVTGIVVEPGVIGINPENVGKDFGRKPNTFRRAEFEQYAADPNAPIPSGIGFPAPWMCSRSRFLALGGMRTEGLPADHQGFTSADLEFLDRWTAAGYQTTRARSYVYHLQRMSEPDEANKPARFEGEYDKIP